MTTTSLSRRDFLHVSAGTIGALGLGSSKSISMITDPADPLAASAVVAGAMQELSGALAQHGFGLRHFQAAEHSPRSDFCIAAAAFNVPLAAAILDESAPRLSRSRESLALMPAQFDRRPGVLASGSDSRGLMYALLELADRIRHAEDPLQALRLDKPVVEAPFNAVRSIGRLFVSEIEDKPWFNDRQFWPPYLAMLAAQRFNRLQLAVGIGYDDLRNVTDAYLLFAYPFFLAVPGYEVRAVGLPDAERERNLQMLQFISAQAVAHGLDFQLGIWTHGYQWTDSPRANYTIEGLTADSHSAYCRDALAALLRACPAISGVTLRTHGESGVREGSYSFWRTVFEGAAQCGRKIEIDLHTKGLDQRMIDGALAAGMPVRLSPKYWAEHLGLPYHQAAIRELEMPREHAQPEPFSELSTGARSFTRYGYADFLRQDRPYSVMYRVWPGTHRLLLSGDPVTAAANARAFGFCGASGAEYFEPLSFKGRRGSGLSGGRCAYADASLQPRWDWEKYLYTYRLWGRHLYNPDTDPESWRRYLSKRFHAQAPAIEAALANATRILPTVTTAHLPSAANDTYFPECYTNQPIADASLPHPYGDTPAPKVFGNVSPLDPQLFLSIRGFAEELLDKERSGKYSPIEVAQWLEQLAAAAARHLNEAARHGGGHDPDFRRIVNDVKIHIGLGRFFAAKLRSASLYALHGRSGHRNVLEQALSEYRRARAVWAQFAQEAGAVYRADVTVGPRPHQRGHWLDRLPAMDRDIEAMAAQLAAARASAGQPQPAAAAPDALSDVGNLSDLTDSPTSSPPCRHAPPAHFVPGEPLPLPLSLSLSLKNNVRPASVRLYYRHVDQAEDYRMAELERHGSEYRAVVPATYTASPYPLQYYFELRQTDRARLYPGLALERANQPYFVVTAAADRNR